MSVVAVYNMKGGVGKTTTAVNLSYLAAAGGQRILLWDLDPQGASSFAFRVRPRVEGFGKRSLESGHVLAAAIKETDYDNLDLLPADFTYRKLDRLLGRFDKPERVVAGLLDTLGRDYDVVFLDCPAGFSLLIEGIFAAADAVLVPAIPTVLSLRMVARLIKWASRSESSAELAAFFSMVDRRKVLHRRACEWSTWHPGVFLAGQIPYASVVEQIAVRCMPLPAFAPRDGATVAFAAIWAELQTRLQHRSERREPPGDKWKLLLKTIESLIERLELVDGPEPGDSRPPLAFNLGDPHWAHERREIDGSHSPPARIHDDVHFVHSFDTESRDLQRHGYILELRERRGSLLLVAAPSRKNEEGDAARRVEAQIDNSWATEIFSGAMSPLKALECRLGRPVPVILDNVRAAIGGRRLVRVNSRAVSHALVRDDSLIRRNA